MASARDVRAGRAYVELGVNDRLAAGLNKAAAKFRAFGASIARIGLGVISVGAAIAAPLALVVKSAVEAGSKLFDMSKRTGVSVEELSKLAFAAQQTGTDLETLEAALRNVAKQSKGVLGTAKDFRAIAREIVKLPTPAERAAAAIKEFGKSGTQLLPMIEQLAELEEQAEKLGLTLSTKDAEALDNFGDVLDMLGSQVGAVRNQIGVAISEAFQPFLEGATRIVSQIIDWVKQNRGLTVTIAAAAGALAVAGGALVVLGVAFSGFGAALALVATGVGTVGTALGAIISPLGIIVVSLGIGTAALLKFTDTGATALAWLADKFGQLQSIATDSFKGIANALAAGNIQLAAQILWTGLQLAWLTGTDDLLKIWYDFKAKMIGAAVSAFFGVQKAWKTVQANLEKAWQTAATAFKVIWAAATKFVQDRFIDIQLAVALAQAKTEQEREILHKQADRLKEKVAGAASRDQAQNITDLVRALAEIDAEQAKVIAALNAAEDKLRRAAESGAEQEKAELQKRIAALKAQLAELNEQAAADRRQIDLSRNVPSPDDLDGIARGLTSRGTFNIAAVQSLQGASDNRVVNELVAIREELVRARRNKAPVVV